MQLENFTSKKTLNHAWDDTFRQNTIISKTCNLQLKISLLQFSDSHILSEQKFAYFIRQKIRFIHHQKPIMS